MKRIVFTSHALYQLRDRGISQIEVRSALGNPDREIRQTDQRQQNVKKMNSRHALVVIFEETEISQVVVTAFLTSKLNKYL